MEAAHEAVMKIAIADPRCSTVLTDNELADELEAGYSAWALVLTGDSQALASRFDGARVIAFHGRLRDGSTYIEHVLIRPSEDHPADLDVLDVLVAAEPQRSKFNRKPEAWLWWVSAHLGANPDYDQIIDFCKTIHTNQAADELPTTATEFA